MLIDLKEQKRLAEIDLIFSQDVKLSVINVISENSDLDEAELRKKAEEIIEKYFDKSIGIEKMGIMLSARGCISNPVTFLEESKRKYLEHYKSTPLPRVNSPETLQKISVIEDDLENKIEKILIDKPKTLGFCHHYWAIKKQILLDDYGIVWYSPAECNPDALYD